VKFGPGSVLALIGAVTFLAAAWFHWIGLSLSVGGVSAGQSFTAYRIPAHFLLDSRSGNGGLNLGIVVLLLGLLGVAAAVLGAAKAPLRMLAVVFGVIAVVVMVIFIWQTRYLADFTNRQLRTSGVGKRFGVFDLLDPGVYIALAGAVVALVGGIVGLTQKR
jgi:hypothetical protein